MHFQRIIALLKWLSTWTVASCLPAPTKICCNCFLWLTATCYFVLILSAPLSSTEDATVKQKMKIFQGVPCPEASGDDSSVKHTSASELKRGWTHCSTVLYSLSEYKISTKIFHFTTYVFIGKIQNELKTPNQLPLRKSKMEKYVIWY